MTTAQYIKLTTEEQFYKHAKIVIEGRYFLDEEGNRITFLTPKEKIFEEFIKLQIDTSKMTIEEIKIALNNKYKSFDQRMLLFNLAKNIDHTPSERCAFLITYISFLEFYLYDYEYEKMPTDVQKEFESYKDFTEQLKQIKY
jgi:hypothetical protein